MFATFASLAIPLYCVSLKLTDASGNSVPAWRIFWTIFGTSNQLLAGLTLMTLSVWLAKSRKSWLVSGVPMVFMLTMTLWALVLMIKPYVEKLFQGAPAFDLIGVVALSLMILALLLIFETVKVMKSSYKKTDDSMIAAQPE